MPAENGRSRQFVLRVLIPVANWLNQKAAKNPANGGDYAGREANAILNEAYTKETGNNPYTGEPIA